MSLRNKIIILAIFPLILSGILGIFVIQNNINELVEIQEAKLHLEAIKSLNEFLSDLGSERGLSYLYLTGATELQTFKESQDITDEAWNNINIIFKNPKLPKEMVEAIFNAKGNLDVLRPKVTNKAYDGEVIFSDYSVCIDYILDELEKLAKTPNSNINKYYEAIISYTKAKENASILHGLISSVYSTKSFIVPSRTVDQIIESYSGILPNLQYGAESWTEEIKEIYVTLTTDYSWKSIKTSMQEIIQKAYNANFTTDGYNFYRNTANTARYIQQIIVLILQEATLWIESQEQVLLQKVIVYCVIMAIIYIINIILAILLAKSIVKRIKNVSLGMKEVSSGDADLTKRINTKLSDELGELAKYFNSFIEMLEGLIGGIISDTQNLNNTMQNLAANSEETASAIRQISSNVEGLKAQTQNQTNSVNESSSAVEQIARNIESLYKLTEKQTESVSSSSSSIEEMIANIQSVTANIERMGSYYNKLLTQSDSGRTSLSTVVKQVRDIDAQSEYLQEANNIISNIAAQTNLLAMNAAIEAAHAGDAGSGFAVVADEIRKLAENSASQTKKISSNIKEIRNVISAVVQSSSTSSKIFDDIFEQIQILSRLEDEIKYSMQEQSSGSGLILDSLSVITEVTMSVKESAREMQTGSNLVLGEMHSLLQLSSELENGMTEMAIGAKEINNSAQSTSELCISAANNVESLTKQTDKFKI